MSYCAIAKLLLNKAATKAKIRQNTLDNTLKSILLSLCWLLSRQFTSRSAFVCRNFAMRSKYRSVKIDARVKFSIPLCVTFYGLHLLVQFGFKM